MISIGIFLHYYQFTLSLVPDAKYAIMTAFAPLLNILDHPSDRNTICSPLNITRHILNALENVCCLGKLSNLKCFFAIVYIASFTISTQTQFSKDKGLCQSLLK